MIDLPKLSKLKERSGCDVTLCQLALNYASGDFLVAVNHLANWEAAQWEKDHPGEPFTLRQQLRDLLIEVTEGVRK